MRLSTLGSAVLGTSVMSIDGATPAALAAVTGGSKFGPAWLSTTKILYQNVTAGSIIQSYDTGTLALATVEATGQNDLAAGNSKWARFLSGTGVKTNIGVGPFSAAALGDVSTDHGEVAIIPNYSAGLGITVYSSAGATLLSLPAVNPGPIIRIRGHLMSYLSLSGTTGWQLAALTGGDDAFAPRLNEPINWITPLVTASGKTFVLERSDRLTFRYSDRPQGWEIVAPGNPTFNPDVMEFSAGVARIGWSSNSGESPGALNLVDLTIATGAIRTGVVSGGGIVWTTGTTLTRQAFAVGPVQGGTGGNSGLYPPVKQSVSDKRTGLMDTSWQAWTQAVSNSAIAANAAVNAIPPSTGTNAISTIAASGQVPIVANGATTITLDGGVTIDSATNTITIGGSGGTVTHTGDLTANALVLGNGAADIKPAASLGTTTTLLHGNAAGAPSFAAVSLTADVTNRLPYANLVASTAASRLLGRTSASAGDWQEISLGSTLALSGTVLGTTTTGVVYTRVPVPITNAQIKTLPSTPVQLVAAPALGFRVKLLSVTVNADTAAGAYVGIDTSYAALSVQTTDGTWLALAVANDDSLTTPLAKLTRVLGTNLTSYFDVAVPYMGAVTGNASGDGEWVKPEVGSGASNFDGKAVELCLDNNGSVTDLTGGHVANSLTITLVYTLEAL